MRKYLYLPLITIALLTMGPTLPNCGSGEDEGCKSDADCPDGQICNLSTSECVDCTPNCTGKCCGPDGCGGTCPSDCPTGYICNTANCQCEPEGCQDDTDCLATQCCQNQVCVDMSCGTLECGPDPVCGKECGPCPAGETCNNGVCETPQDCTDENDCTDPNTQCCINSVCTDMACGTLECGPDPVCGYECGPCPAGETCNNGVCEEIATGDLCPSGQECVQVGANGSMGCVIPPNTVPPENATDCANVPCEGNMSCYCMDQTCSQSHCIENCGSCPDGQECCQYTQSGIMACMLTGCNDEVPNPPYCDQNTPCQGNAGCFTDGTNNWCATLCSLDYGPCTNGETKCDGEVVQTCTNGAWVSGTDCSTTSEICVDGACITPPGLGEFCENTGLKCAAGLECIGTADSTHAFCTPPCDCTQGTGCDTDWECLFGDGDPPTNCWCAKLCTTDADCPDGGAGGYSCVVLANDGTNDIYGCMVN